MKANSKEAFKVNITSKALVSTVIALTMVIAGLMLVIPKEADAQPAPVAISGTVYDGHGNPVGGATVTVSIDSPPNSATTTSFPDGQYSVLLTGNYGAATWNVSGEASYQGWEGSNSSSFPSTTTQPLPLNITMDWYFKPESTGAPSGMPDFDQKQFLDPAMCGPTAVADCFWWYDASHAAYDDLVTTSDPTTLITQLHTTLGNNPVAGIDPVTMQAGINDWLNSTGTDQLLYEHTEWQPNFTFMEDELERCQDVMLLFGFWYYNESTMEWYRVGGHWVTMAGVNSIEEAIAVSDPYYDWNGTDMGPGRTLPPGHDCSTHGTTNHNNPANVSHDYYAVSTGSISPGGDLWLPDYPATLDPAYFTGMNVPFNFTLQSAPWDPIWPIHTEIEAAVMVSPLEVCSIDLEKTVWNGTAWADYTEEEIGNTVTFNLTVENTGVNTYYDWMHITDVLPAGLSYVSGTATVTPDSTSPLEWNITGPINQSEVLYIEFDATVDETSYNMTNDADVEARCVTSTGTEMVTDMDNATVFGLPIPGMDVSKYVWDGTQWTDFAYVRNGTNASYKMVIENTGQGTYNLTDISIVDTLESSLNFTNATPAPDNVTGGPPSDTTIEWEFYDTGGVTCDYTLSVDDTYGDTWNGGYLDVYVNGGLVYSGLEADDYTPGTWQDYPITVSDGDTIFLDYTYGSFPYENEWELKDCSGTVVFSQTGGYSDTAYDHTEVVSLTCDYTLSVDDTYGDTWNGGYLDVYVNGGLVYSGLEADDYTPGTWQDYPITVAPGDTIFLDYTYGSFPYENEWELKDCSGTVVFSQTGGYSDTAYDHTETVPSLLTRVPGLPVGGSITIYMNATAIAAPSTDINTVDVTATATVTGDTLTGSDTAEVQEFIDMVAPTTTKTFVGPHFEKTGAGGGPGPIYSEDFSGGVPPTGWSQEEPGEWVSDDDNDAGGMPPQAQLSWLDINGDYAYLDSKAVDTSGMSSLYLQFKSYIDDYSGGYDCNVYTRADSGDTWTDVTPWTNPIDGDVGPDTYEIDISHDIGTGTQVRFEFDGYYFYINDWSLDDFKLAEEFVEPPAIFSEDFEDGYTGWTVHNMVGAGSTWDWENTVPGGVDQDGADGYWMAIGDDDDDVTPNVAALVSPTFDCSAYENVMLNLAGSMQAYAGDGELWMNISTDGGATWQNVYTVTDDENGPWSLDISSYADMESDVRLNFTFSDEDYDDAWGALIDNVRVTGDMVFPTAGDYVTTDTDVWLNATDDISGVNYLHVKIWWDENLNYVEDPGEVTEMDIYDGDAEDENPADGEVSYRLEFDNECYHEVSYYAVDEIGNVEDTQSEVDFVDDTPPTTALSFDGPHWNDGTYDWVSCDTNILLEPSDAPEICGVDNSTTYYRYWNQFTGWTDWQSAGGPGGGADQYSWDFNSGQGDWTTTDPGGDGYTWEWTDVIVSACDLGGASGHWMGIDDDDNDYDNYGEELISPTVDCSGWSNAELSWTGDFEDMAGYGQFWVNVSADGGSTWTNVYFRTEDLDPAPSGGFADDPALPVDVSSVVAGSSNVVIKFTYADTDPGYGSGWAWGAMVDDVLLNNTAARSDGRQASFTLPDDGTYYVEYYSNDALGNNESAPNYTNVHNVTIKADCTPPEIDKTIGDPQYYDSDEDKMYVNSTTPFTLLASEQSPPGPPIEFYLEDFEAGQGAWTTTDPGGDGYTWEWTNVVVSACDQDGASGYWMGIDDDDNDYDNYGEELISPTIDCTGRENVVLDFDGDFETISGAFWVNVSADGGSTWHNLYYTDAAVDPGGFDQDPNLPLDVSVYADNNPNFVVKFTYSDGGVWDWGAMIDNVRLIEHPSIQGVTSGFDTAEYRVWYNGHWTDWTDFGSSTVIQPFDRQCKHYLEVRAMDMVGNIQLLNQTYYVDNAGPLMNVTVGDPFCYGTHVTSDTKITVDPSDSGNFSLSEPSEARKTFYAYNAYDPTGTLPEGPVSFPDNNPGSITSLATSTTDFIAGGCWANGVWYGVEYGTNNLWTIDEVTGDMTLVGNTGAALNGICYDDSLDTFYGVGDGNLYTVDPVTGTATLVGPHNAGMTIISLASDGNGNLYGHSVSFTTTDNLYSFDPYTGQSTLIGSLGVSMLYAQDAAYDKDTGILYLAGYTEAYEGGDGPVDGLAPAGRDETRDGGLYICDTSTADLTLIGGFENNAEITGFAIPYTAGPGGPDPIPGCDSGVQDLEYRIWYQGSWSNWVNYPGYSAFDEERSTLPSSDLLREINELGEDISTANDTTGIWVDEKMETPEPEEPTRAGNVIYEQVPHTPSQSWTAATSDTGLGYKVQENFWDVTGTTQTVTWYGLTLYFTGSSWIPGDPAGMNFYLEFYDDPSDVTQPTNMVQSFDISSDDVTVTDTGLDYSGYSMYKFEASLPSGVSLPEGWIAVQSHDDPQGDSLLWMSSPQGDGYAYQSGSGSVTYDLAFTLYGAPPGITLDGECTHYVEARATDNLGQTRIINQTYKVDNSPPVTTTNPNLETKIPGPGSRITLSVEEGGACPVGGYTIYWKYAGTNLQHGGINETVYLDAPAQGTYTIEYWAVDCLGNEEEHHVVEFRVLPEERLTDLLYFEGPHEWMDTHWDIAANTLVKFDLQEAHDIGIREIWYVVDDPYDFENIDGPWTKYTGGFTVPQGEWSIYYYGIDDAGRRTPVTRVVVDVSAANQAPVPTCTFDPETPNGNNGWYTTPVDVTLTANDPEGDTATIWYKVDDGEWTEYTSPFTISEHEEHTIQYYAEDEYNHRLPTNTRELKIDQDAPEITMHKPVTGTLYLFNRNIMPLPEKSTIIVGKIDVEVSVSDPATSGIAGATLVFDGEVKETFHDHITWTLDEFAIGQKTITVEATDKAGNSAKETIAVWMLNL